MVRYGICKCSVAQTKLAEDPSVNLFPVGSCVILKHHRSAVLIFKECMVSACSASVSIHNTSRPFTSFLYGGKPENNSQGV